MYVETKLARGKWIAAQSELLRSASYKIAKLVDRRGSEGATTSEIFDTLTREEQLAVFQEGVNILDITMDAYLNKLAERVDEEAELHAPQQHAVEELFEDEDDGVYLW